MKQICRYLGITVIVLGIIASFITAKKLGVEVSLSSFSYSLWEERNWASTFAYFFLGILITGVFSAILLGISETLERLETLETIETTLKDTHANNHLKGVPNVTSTNNPVPSSYWKCPKCGKNNPNHTGTCGCGCEKP